MRKYEILYIIRPDIAEDAKKELIERFDAILTNNGAEIIESADWGKGKKRFAYEINDFTEGYYQKVDCQTETTTSIDEFDRLALINRDILRHMIVKLED